MMGNDPTALPETPTRQTGSKRPTGALGLTLEIPRYLAHATASGWVLETKGVRGTALSVPGGLHGLGQALVERGAIRSGEIQEGRVVRQLAETLAERHRAAFEQGALVVFGDGRFALRAGNGFGGTEVHPGLLHVGLFRAVVTGIERQSRTIPYDSLDAELAVLARSLWADLHVESPAPPTTL